MTSLRMFGQLGKSFVILLLCIIVVADQSAAAEVSVALGPMPACWSPQELAARKKEGRAWESAGASANFPRVHTATSTVVPPVQRGSIREVRLPSGKKLVALTFDLCEAAFEITGYQGRIVDFLRANNIKATFFISGKWILTHRERAKQLISDSRFEVGNHGWEHRNLRTLTGAALGNEINNTDIIYEQARNELTARKCIGPNDIRLSLDVVPEKMSLFRFPFGACNEKSMVAVNESGHLAIQWSITSDDPSPYQDARQMRRMIMAQVHSGSIILFHANGRGLHTDDALPLIVSDLKAQGYEFATVSELINSGEPIIAKTCYDRHVGDSDQYDALSRRYFDHHVGPRVRK